MKCPIDLTDPTVQADPYAAYDDLRDTAPVCQDAKTGIWQILPYDLVMDATRDAKGLSSRGANQRLPTGDLGEKIEAIYSERSVCPMEILVSDDDPAHAYHRSLVDKVFTVSRVRQMDEYLTQLVDEMIGKLRSRNAIEFVMEFAMLVPGHVIADQMGFPREDVPQFRRWTDAIMESKNPRAPQERLIELAYELREFHIYLVAKIAEFREQPIDRILSDLVHVEKDGQQLTDREIVNIARQIVVAGIESTANAMASAIIMLAGDMGLQDRLRGEPALVPRFVEEVLRLESPFQGLFRRTKEDYAIGGTLMPGGEEVMLRFGAANRDPRQFERPDELLLDRKNGRNHLAFGVGAHFCIGNQLARSELRIALTMLLAATNRIAIAPGDESIVRPPHYFIRGVQRLQLEIDWD